MSIIGDGLEILALIDKAKNADVYRQLGDYIDKIRDQQLENDRLHTEVRELSERLRFKGILLRINGHVFAEGDEEELCPRCAEVDHQPVHLMRFRNDKGQVRLRCPECDLISHLNFPVKRADAHTTQTE